ncbi:chemotaxis protein CheW [Methanoregula formicica]|uniref:Chemotaxis signal transduction protein n=1 Tax=Methanoregula formicica (strain DSM 22288 / NBRC 105244 / SMSP) TaxID=593750 RepID=L0HH90_METFS|nr:chemotaxis protein CheW [Methanoregula formicica]AGB02663.1 chemotaxis signal transduction protein [Methanoregula formicica SMSP]
MASTIDIVEFELGGERYALDIQLAREIVEMIPITPIPRAPAYISGVINLRGEITNIMNLNTLLGLPDQEVRTNQKIIVLVPEATGGSNVGIIVDDVSSVIQVSESDVDKVGEGFGSDSSAFVKGIIKMKTEEAVADTKKNLIIWIDMEKVIRDLVEK